MRRILQYLGVLMLLLIGASTPAQSQAPVELAITQVITSDYPDVIAVVTVRDASGGPLGGLEVNDFSASEDGVVATVTDAHPVIDSDVGLAVVLLLDTSESMAGTPLDSVRQAALRFVDSLLEGDEALVIPFADSVGTDRSFISDKTELAAEILGLEAGGFTALYDAVVAGVDAAEGAAAPRRVVILLTDGYDWGGRSAFTRDQSLQRVSQASIPVFVVALGEEVDQRYLKELAEASGGEVLVAPAPADVPGVYDRIGTLLRAQHLVYLKLPGEADGQVAELVLTVRLGEATASGSIAFRRPAAEGAGGPPPVIWGLLAGLALAVLTLVGMAGIRRLRARRALRRAGPIRPEVPFEAPPPPAAGERVAAPPPARLVVIEGTEAGRAVYVREQPVTLGSDADCTLRLADSMGQVGGHHARVWLREGRYMLHHLDERRTTLVGERPVRWAVLEPGDEITIGPHRLRFDLPTQGNSVNQPT